MHFFPLFSFQNIFFFRIKKNSQMKNGRKSAISSLVLYNSVLGHSKPIYGKNI